MLKTQLVKLYSYLVNRGVPTEVVDLELEFGRPRDEVECAAFLELAKARLSGAEFDFIGVSCYTSLSFLSTLEIAKIVRRLNPSAIIAVGGYHCLGNFEDFAEAKEIDHIVRGCGLQYLENFFAGEPLPRLCSYKGSAPNPVPMRYAEYPYRYHGAPAIANIQLSRGCPFQCAFCCEPFTQNSVYVPLSIETALDSVEEVVREIAPAKIVIEDVLFGFNSGWRQEFLVALQAKQYEQIFWLEMRVDIITERTVALLSQMNVDMTIGLESLSVHTLRNMRKSNHPDRYIEAFFRTVKLFHDYDVPVTYTIMLNYPGETYESFSETIANIERAQAMVDDPCFRFDFLEYSFYPGNSTFSEIDQLNREHGTEIGDRVWYTRTDGQMLEKALCTVPSRDLLGRFGREGIRQYFQQSVERIEARTSAARRPRSTLARAWRFFDALKRRLAPWRSFNFFSRGPALGQRSLSSVAALVPIHARLTQRLLHSFGPKAGEDWAERERAWHCAVDIIAHEISGDPSALHEGDVSGLLPSLAYAVEEQDFQPWIAADKMEDRPTRAMWAKCLRTVHQT